MKRFISILSAVFLLAAMCLSVCAVEPRATNMIPTLSFNGTTANCKVIITSYGNDIDATMELWNGSKLVDSWSDEGTSTLTITGSRTVTKGVTYTLKVYGTADGQSFSSTPLSKTC